MGVPGGSEFLGRKMLGGWLVSNRSKNVVLDVQ